MSWPAMRIVIDGNALEWTTALSTVAAVLLALGITVRDHFKSRRDEETKDLDESRRLLIAAIDDRDERVRTYGTDDYRTSPQISTLMIASVINALVNHSKLITEDEATRLSLALRRRSKKSPTDEIEHDRENELINSIRGRLDEACRKRGK